MKICFIFAVIGLFQEFSYLVNFKYGYYYDYLHLYNQLSFSGIMMRVTSLTNEPSFLIYALMPAFHIALSSFLTAGQKPAKQWKNMVIILCTFLTYSAVGYAGIFLSFSAILFWNLRQIKFNRILLFIITGIFLFSLGKSAVSERIFYTYKQLTHSVNHAAKENKEYVNMSSYYLALHAKRAFDDFKHNTLFGTGLGSYTYPERADEVYKKFHYKKFFHVSSEDVANIFFRIVSEFGLFGIIILFIFLFSNYIFNISFRNKTNYFMIINNACLIYIMLRLLRNGSYYSDGLWIFIFMYYYSKKLFLEQNKNENA
ncbi:MAG: O-antigen ligase family protein [Endomicrobiaceae bacterium]|nr:O-antigen ligase family protein [Endomicrobiaceae bacterium]